MDFERKVDHWSARTVLTKAESEEVKGAEKRETANGSGRGDPLDAALEQ